MDEELRGRTLETLRMDERRGEQSDRSEEVANLRA
jgi:hypothetical protein